MLQAKCRVNYTHDTSSLRVLPVSDKKVPDAFSNPQFTRSQRQHRPLHPGLLPEIKLFRPTNCFADPEPRTSRAETGAGAEHLT